MAEDPPPTPAAAARALLDDPVDLRRTRAAVLGAMFGGQARPTTIGRFEIVATAGRGAMGRVYVAFDPELDRTVALKLIVDDGDPGTAEERRGRLVSEAQAMAQLTHPNVVSVYEVGRHDGDVFIVMQYVTGPSLRRWAAVDRSLDERLATLVGAARGLAAAHAADIVHRDFKPDNVLVDQRGRAFVTDFGLARSLESVPDGSVDTTTTTGGTPAYMAPEQAQGSSGGPASDQFAFCVTAWEVLTGGRPRRREPTREVVFDEDEVRLPTWLRRVLVRGMATEPALRWPSMDALVGALERRGGRTRTAVLAVLGVTIAAIVAVSAGGEPDVCADAGAPISEHWNDARREALRQAFAETTLAYATAASEHAVARLDAYHDEWTAAAKETCEISRDGRWSDTMIDRGQLCLASARSSLRAATQVLVRADPEVVRRMTAIVGELPPIDACLDPEALTAELAPPRDDIADEVLEQRDRLADARAAFWAGREREAGELADEVLDAAQTIGWAPLRAEAMFLRAHVYDQVRDVDGARELYLDSYFLAGEIGYDRIAAQAATELVSTFGPDEEGLDEAHEWARHARMVIGRAPRLQRYATRASQYVAWAEMEANNLAKAAEAASRAHDEAIETFGPDHEQTGHALAIMGIVAMQRGDEGEALDLQRRALAIVEPHKPPGHPTIARLLNNIGIVARKAGALDEAAGYLNRSLRAKIDLYGERHPSVATAYNGLGLLEADRGRFDEARAQLERSLALREQLLAPDHPDIWVCWDNLAYVAVYGGEYERAVELGRAALAGRRAAEHDPQRLVITGVLLAHGLAGLRRGDEALVVVGEVLTTLQANPDPALEAEARIARAAALLSLHRAAEARAELQAAADAGAPYDAETEGHRRLLLGRALQQLGAPRPEVLLHAHKAVELLDTPLMKIHHDDARALVREVAVAGQSPR